MVWLRNLLQTTATFHLTCSSPADYLSRQGYDMIDVGIYEDDLLAVHKTIARAVTSSWHASMTR